LHLIDSLQRPRCSHDANRPSRSTDCRLAAARWATRTRSRSCPSSTTASCL